MFTSRSSRSSLRGLPRSTAILGATTAAVVGLSVIGVNVTSASAIENPTVSLTVNGTTTAVTTTATTVDAVLDERNVEYDANDLLNPGPATPVSDGLTINLRQAVAVSVVDDSVRSRKIVTAQTVTGLRRELNLPSKPELRLRQFEGFAFERTTIYGPQGNVRAGSDTLLEGSVAVIENVRVAFPEGRYRVQPRVIKDRSPLVRAGDIKVMQQGRAGRKHVVWRKRFVDQELVAKRAADTTILRAPKRRVVKVGTGPNWQGLANCESGGNPNAVNSAGFYGLYQFSASTWRSVGGKGIPTDYGYWEQTKRAWILYKGSGSSPWPVCGRYL